MEKLTFLSAKLIYTPDFLEQASQKLLGLSSNRNHLLQYSSFRKGASRIPGKLNLVYRLSDDRSQAIVETNMSYDFDLAPKVECTAPRLLTPLKVKIGDRRAYDVHLIPPARFRINNYIAHRLTQRKMVGTDVQLSIGFGDNGSLKCKFEVQKNGDEFEIVNVRYFDRTGPLTKEEAMRQLVMVEQRYEHIWVSAPNVPVQRDENPGCPVKGKSYKSVVTFKYRIERKVFEQQPALENA